MPSQPHEPNAAEILAALQCSRPGCTCHASSRKGEGLTHCPVHADNTPSFNVEDKGGRVLMCCQSKSACSQEAVIEELRRRGLWPERKREQPLPRGTNAPRSKETIYESRDIDGKLIATHKRVDTPGKPKQFYWEREGKKGLDGLAVEDVPLYGTHLLKGHSGPVVVCEGQKSADAVRKLGTLALGTVSGAKKTPSFETLRTLEGREVYLWPDNDDEGRSHMDRIAARLFELGAEVYIITWPDAPPKGDAADYLFMVGEEGASQGLEDLLAQAAIWKPEPRKTLVCLADIEPEEVRWLWYPYIPYGKLTILEGDPGIGKSFVSLAIATAISHGVGLPRQEGMDQGKVLLMMKEDGSADTIRPRLDKLGGNLHNLFIEEAPLSLDPEGVDAIEDNLRYLRPSLVIIDPIVAYIGAGVDIHRANETRAMLTGLIDLSEKYKCSILAVRHLSKATGGKAIYRGMGSIDFVAAVRSLLLAGRDDKTGQTAIIHTKSNLAPLGEPVGYELREDGFFWLDQTEVTADGILGNGGHDDEQKSVLEDAQEMLKELLAEGPKPAKEVLREAREHGISYITLNRAKSKLGIKPKRFSWGWEWPQYIPKTNGTSSHKNSDNLDHLDHVGNVIDLMTYTPPHEKKEKNKLGYCDSEDDQGDQGDQDIPYRGNDDVKRDDDHVDLETPEEWR